MSRDVTKLTTRRRMIRLLLWPLCAVSAFVLMPSAQATLCDEPDLLPVGHVVIARCDTVENANVSGTAAVIPEGVDVCIVRGRDFAWGDDPSYDRSYGWQQLYYIGGSLSFRDAQTEQLVTVENFGQYWWRWADIFSFSCIAENRAGVFFYERISCGVGDSRHYRIYGSLDKQLGVLHYRYETCDKQTELDFISECSVEQ